MINVFNIRETYCMTVGERRQEKLAIGHKRHNRHILLNSFVIYIKVTLKI